MVMMSELLKLDAQQRGRIFNQVAMKAIIPSCVVEKDWWVTEILRIIFSSCYAPAFVFKGGTSLSKAYDIIQRFSEDIDLAIDRNFLGCSDELTRSGIKSLRKKSVKFLTREFATDLKKRIEIVGLPLTSFEIEFTTSDSDPIRISITYSPLTKDNEYIQPKILLEISCRSLREPFEEVTIRSWVDQEYPKTDFTSASFNVKTAKPEKTFIEKIFLLHEEWQKKDIRVNRLSRHLYDLYQLMDTKYSNIAMNSRELYFEIIDHRRKFNAIKGVNYDLHCPKHIKIIPPESVLNDYQIDYENMKENMILGEKPSWNELVNNLLHLQDQVHSLSW